MRNTIRFARWAPLPALFVLLVLAGCQSDRGGDEGSWTCPIDAPLPPTGAVFTNPTQITHTHFPLVANTAKVYRGMTEDGLETTVVEVLATTRVVNGVTCVRVRDRVYLDDLLIEDTEDWYAQDDAGNVWYFGEDVTNYEYDDNDMLIGTNSDGSWEAGLDVASVGVNARAGIAFPATPTVGVAYHQEYYPGEAEDRARIEALNVMVTLADGRVFNNCVQVMECNPLEEDSEEFKYYAPGVGLLREQSFGGPVTSELKGSFITGAANAPNFGAAVFTSPTVINNSYFPLTAGSSYTYRVEDEGEVEVVIVDVLSATQVVNGVTCRVVRDRVYVDGRLIEDTLDWYAQDNAGNVWYMGEDVTNFYYNASGMLTGSDNAGSWEAGVMGALPGHIMPATQTAGTAHVLEFWAGEAEDVAQVLQTGVTITLSSGTQYTNCVRTVDWNPLNPVDLAYKVYAPGVGFVYEAKVDQTERVELTGVTP